MTGCAGFISSNFLPYFLEKYLEYYVVNLDLLTNAGNLENLEEIVEYDRYRFVNGHICNLGVCRA